MHPVLFDGAGQLVEKVEGKQVKWNSASVRRTSAKQREWAHVKGGWCSCCEKGVQAVTRAGAKEWKPEDIRKHQQSHYGVTPGEAPMLDGEGHEVDVDLVPDIMHLAMNIVKWLIQFTILNLLPTDDKDHAQERGAMVSKLILAVEDLPVNLWNFGLNRDHCETTKDGPSPTGGEVNTLLACFPHFVDVVCPAEDAATGQPAHPKREQVVACWNCMLVLYCVLWDDTVGDAHEQRAWYKECVSVSAIALLHAVITCCGTNHSCVYFHEAVWHLPLFAYKYGPLRRFCAQAIELHNHAIKAINTNGQKLQAEGEQAGGGLGKRPRTTRGVPAQILISQHIVTDLNAEYPIRKKIQNHHKLMTGGWRSEFAITYQSTSECPPERSSGVPAARPDLAQCNDMATKSMRDGAAAKSSSGTYVS